MNEPTNSPPTAPSAPPIATSPDGPTFDRAGSMDRRGAAARAFLGMGVPDPVAAAPTETAAPVETPPAAPEPATQDLPAKDRAAMLNSLRQAQTQALQHQRAAKEAQERLEQLTKELESARKDPIAALKLAGMTPDQLAQAMIEGKIKRQEDTAKLPPEVQAKLEQLEKLSTQWEQEQEQKRQSAARAEDTKLVKSQLEAAADMAPLTAAMPGAEDILLNGLYQELQETGQQPDVQEHIQRFEQALMSQVRSILSSEGARRLLLKDESFRATLAAELGGVASPASVASRAAPSDSRGRLEPATLPRSAAESPATNHDTPEARAARKAAAARAFLASKG